MALGSSPLAEHQPQAQVKRYKNCRYKQKHPAAMNGKNGQQYALVSIVNQRIKSDKLTTKGCIFDLTATCI